MLEEKHFLPIYNSLVFFEAMDAGELKRGPHLSFGAKTGDIWTRWATIMRIKHAVFNPDM